MNTTPYLITKRTFLARPISLKSIANILAIILTTSILAACSTTETDKKTPELWSHQAFTMENDEQLAERRTSWEKWEVNHGSSNASFFFLSTKALSKAQQKRELAQDSSFQSENKLKRPLKSVSSKGLYFLSLFEQYLTLKKISHFEQNIAYCPAFHSARLEYFPVDRKAQTENYNFPLSSLNWEKIKAGGSESLALFPELALPIQAGAPFPGVIEALEHHMYPPQKTNMILSQALYLQTQKLHQELEALCEYGDTENSYIFENTLTYLKDNHTKLTANEALKIFMRLPVFTNLTLLKALIGPDQSSRLPASVAMRDSFENELIGRLQAPWIKGYWAQITKLRSEHLK